MYRSLFSVFIIVIFSMFYLGCEQGMEPTSDSMEILQSTTSSNLVWPAGQIVDEAVFSIYVHSTWGDTKIEAFTLTSDWSEDGVNWNWADFNNTVLWGTAGGDIGAKVGEFDVPWDGADSWYDIDVTALVNDWITNEGTNNFGILLKHSTVNPVYGRVQYHSSEYTDSNLRPKFTLYHDNTTTEIQGDNVDDSWFDSLDPNTNFGQDQNLQTRIIFDESTPPLVVREKRVVVKFPLDIEDQQEPSCETAFAFGGSYATCFLEPILGFDNWGWTNGELLAGYYTFDVYAGAGQCDLSKGTLVGNVTVDYDGSTATVTYNMNTGFTMSEVHLFVGNEMLPRDKKGFFTNAPGKYTIVDDDLGSTRTWTSSVSGLSGPIYVVAHAVVCGEF